MRDRVLVSTDVYQHTRPEQMEKNVLVPSLNRIIWDRVECVETVVVTCGAVDDVPGCGWVVKSGGVHGV